MSSPKRRKRESVDLDDEWERFQSEVADSNPPQEKQQPSVLDAYKADVVAEAVDIHGRSMANDEDANVLEESKDVKQEQIDQMEEVVQELQEDEAVQEDLKERLARVKQLRKEKSAKETSNGSDSVTEGVVTKESGSLDLKTDNQAEVDSDSDSDFDEAKLWTSRGI